MGEAKLVNRLKYWADIAGFKWVSLLTYNMLLSKQFFTSSFYCCTTWVTDLNFEV